jgi:predicted nucleotidyltransferase
MQFQDYEEFIAALNGHGVKYLIVGTHAVAFHARPRATKDLDILLEPTPANARRALLALRDFFGGADLGYTVEDLTDPRWIIQLGIAPVRIDLLSAVPGCPNFAVAWKKRVEARFGSIKAYYIGLEELIRVKEATGRAQDRADALVLRRAKSQVKLTRPREKCQKRKRL